MSFPNMSKRDDWLKLSGFLSYRPWVRFDEKIMGKLQDVVQKYYSPEGCENPDVLLDFRECTLDENNLITHRSEMILYRDGGDWAEKDDMGNWHDIGFLFARRDIDQTTNPNTVSYRVHLPSQAIQNTFLPFIGKVTDQLAQGDGEPLRKVQEYLDSVINDQNAWENLEDLVSEEDEE